MRSAAASRPRPSPETPGTVRAALRGGAARLGVAGVPTPRLDAEVLLADVLGVERLALVGDGDRALGEAEATRFAAAIARRTAREPVAYITGRRGFRRLELTVDPRVLVPRPETETLVEAALELAPPAARVCDVGTGSGAVALALADERPDLVVLATDLSADALAVARANAARLGLPVGFAQGDLLAGVDGPLDLVVANLPYVAEADLDGLAPEIARHEPRSALAAGPDGLDAIRRLAAEAAERAVPCVALEVGAGQAAAVVALLRRAGWADAAARPDLAGIDRVVAGRR